MKRYCRLCGSLLKPYTHQYFNELTGKPIQSLKCFNPKYEDGCVMNGGHQFRFFGFSSICKLCKTNMDCVL